MTPMAPSEKALAAARDLLNARRLHFSPCMSFSASSESQASKVTELPGFKDNCLSDERSDSTRSGHDDVVALSQREADKFFLVKSLRGLERSSSVSLGDDMHVFLYTSYRRGVESPYVV